MPRSKPVSELTRRKWDQMIDYIQNSGQLNDWEKDFMQSLFDRRSVGDLSMKQSSKLRDIYKREQEKIG